MTVAEVDRRRRAGWYCGVAVAVVALALAGCEEKSSPRARREPARPPAEEAMIEIPLDDAEAGAEVSLARNFYFILDGSGSMSSEPGYACRGDQRSATKLEGAQGAVREFLQKIPDDVRIGLYVFDQRGQREVVPLGTDNRQEFLAQIDDVQAGMGTPLAPAIVFGTNQLVKQYKKQLGYGEYRLVVVTDGMADGIPEAAHLATRYGMPIYAIGLCIEEDHPLREYAVSYRAADSFSDLARGLEETLAELPAFDVTEFTPEQE